MKRQVFVASLGVGLTASVQTTAFAQQLPRKIRYGIAPAEDAALASYALAKGYFARAGLEVELTMFPSGGAITPGLLGGALDIGVTNTGAMASAHVAGIPLSLIASGSLYTHASPSAHLVILKSGPFRTLRELNGKTIALSSLREFAHCSVLQWLDRSGVDSKSVNFIQMPLANAVTALQTGHVDAIDLVEPLYSRWKSDLIDLGTPFAAVADGKPVQIFGTVATKSFIDANLDLVKRLGGALRQAAHWANDSRNRREAAAIISDFTKVDVEAINAYPRLRFAESIDVATIQPAIDMLAKYGFISRSFAASELLVPPLAG
jgi:NitT/TauT family transport system substrate-binding protein